MRTQKGQRRANPNPPHAHHRARGQCLLTPASVDPFTITEKMNTVRRGNTVKLTIRIGNVEVFDIPATPDTLQLDVPVPAGTTYRKSKLSALPDSAVGPKGTPQVKAVLVAGAPQVVQWKPFQIPANMTRPRTAYVWFRINKDTTATSIPFTATITDTSQGGCFITAGPETVRGSEFGVAPNAHNLADFFRSLIPHTWSIGQPQVSWPRSRGEWVQGPFSVVGEAPAFDPRSFGDAFVERRSMEKIWKKFYQTT